MNQAARYVEWLADLRQQGHGLLLCLALAALAVFYARLLWRGFPRCRGWLPWAGVGGFYASLVALWAAVRAGLIG